MEKKKILVIDDEENFTKLIKKNLELTGEFEVRTENNARLGLDAAKEFKPDLILLDIAMPEMDGYEMANSIRGIGALKNTSIIFMTGKELDSKGIEERVLKLGAYGYISKTFHFEEILAKIKETL